MSKKKLPPGIRERAGKKHKKDGKVQTRWIIDTTYKGHKIWETYATPESAEANLHKITSLIDEGKYLDKKKECKKTFGDLKTEYLKWCEKIGQKDVRSKKQRAKVIEDIFKKDTQLSTITRAKVENFQADRLSSLSTKSGEVLKPATVNREMALLKHMFTKATEWEWISQSPAKGVKLKKENNRRLRYLTPEECKQLIEACPSQTMKQVVTLAIHTGMRRGEILNLKWDNVNLRDKFIELTGSDQKNGERSTIPLTATALETLRSIPRRLDSKYVFTGKTSDKPFYDLKRQFEKAVENAKLAGVTFHILRHTCASHLVMAGIDLVSVKEIMRHKSIDMTLRYSHLAPAHKKAAMAALEAALQPKEQNETEQSQTA